MSRFCCVPNKEEWNRTKFFIPCHPLVCQESEAQKVGSIELYCWYSREEVRFSRPSLLLWETGMKMVKEMLSVGGCVGTATESLFLVLSILAGMGGPGFLNLVGHVGHEVHPLLL